MSSFLRSVRRRKKSRRLGEVQIVRREDFEDLDLDARVQMIRALIPLGLMHAEELLEQEIEALAGPWYARKAGRAEGVRSGSNPGSIPLAGQRVPIRVPRVRGRQAEIPLRSYAALKRSRGEVDDVLLKRVLFGISCRNYAL